MREVWVAEVKLQGSEHYEAYLVFDNEDSVRKHFEHILCVLDDSDVKRYVADYATYYVSPFPVFER